MSRRKLGSMPRRGPRTKEAEPLDGPAPLLASSLPSRSAPLPCLHWSRPTGPGVPMPARATPWRKLGSTPRRGSGDQAENDVRPKVPVVGGGPAASLASSSSLSSSLLSSSSPPLPVLDSSSAGSAGEWTPRRQEPQSAGAALRPQAGGPGRLLPAALQSCPDVLTCGRCLLIFPLSQIMAFIEHKRGYCQSPSRGRRPDGDTGSPEPSAFSCSTCGSCFMGACALLCHAQESHGLAIYQSRPSPAEEGGAPPAPATPVPTRAAAPVRTRNHACDFCGKAFHSRSNLMVHRRSHTGERPFHCPRCPYASAQNSKLTRHMRTHQRADSALAPPERADSPGALPAGPLEDARGGARGGVVRHRGSMCEFCGKIFGSSSSLTVHRRSHTGERPFACLLCPYASSQSSKLTRHLRIHGSVLDPPSFRCPHCSVPYGIQATLDKHLRQQHGELGNGSGH